METPAIAYQKAQSDFATFVADPYTVYEHILKTTPVFKDTQGIWQVNFLLKFK